MVVLAVKKSPASEGRCNRCGLDPWVGKIPWKRQSNPFQYSCLENPMERGAWRAMVHRVAQSQTWLKQFSVYLYIYVCVCVCLYIYMHIKLFLIIHSSYVPLHHCLHWIREYWIMVLGEMLLVTTFLSIKWCIILFNVCFYSKTSLSSLTLISLSIVL